MRSTHLRALAMLLLGALYLVGCSGSDEQVDEAVTQSEEDEDALLGDDQQESDQYEASEQDEQDEQQQEQEEVAGVDSEDTDSYQLDTDEDTASELAYQQEAEDSANAADDAIDEIQSIVEDNNAEDEASEVVEALPVPEPVEPVAEEAVAPSYAGDATASTGEGRYVVRPGDSLASIAKQIFGDSARFNELASYNNIADANRIFPGDVIKFEMKSETESFATAYDQVAMQTVTVSKGDSLYKLAANVLGSGSHWKYLWRFNEAEVSNPNSLKVGQTLKYVSLNADLGTAH